MAALDALRTRWVDSCVGLGTSLLVLATRGICTGSLRNADLGRADTRARLDEWAGVLSLYDPATAREYDVPLTVQVSA
jgi:hypothetical protein